MSAVKQSKTPPTKVWRVIEQRITERGAVQIVTWCESEDRLVQIMQDTYSKVLSIAEYQFGRVAPAAGGDGDE